MSSKEKIIETVCKLDVIFAESVMFVFWSTNRVAQQYIFITNLKCCSWANKKMGQRYTDK